MTEKRKIIHLHDQERRGSTVTPFRYTICGNIVRILKVTRFKNKVTCKNCLRTMKSRSR